MSLTSCVSSDVVIFKASPGTHRSMYDLPGADGSWTRAIPDAATRRQSATLYAPSRWVLCLIRLILRLLWWSHPQQPRPGQLANWSVHFRLALQIQPSWTNQHILIAIRGERFKLGFISCTPSILTQIHAMYMLHQK